MQTYNFFNHSYNLQFLQKLNIGIEKEGLRVDKSFNLSKKAHPKALGSKLTHSFITTDYAEALLEFVTPVFNDSNELLKFLVDLHHYTYLKMDGELIWPASMPCRLPKNDSDIAVANYGKSNLGRLKELYRIGLGNRYGRKMQSIAGLHFNFSMPADFITAYSQYLGSSLDKKNFRNKMYFDLVRNFRRYSWLLMYLFGASPVVDKSFLEGKKHDLKLMGKDSYGLPYATALRMGGLGYTSNAQKEINVCYNQIDTYIKSLENARTTSYRPYEKMGLKEKGEYKQLNCNLLQIDNEYYSTIRPKSNARSGQSALQALWENGIEYIEVRIMDLDPFSVAGISQETIHFLKSFLIFCLLEDSPAVTTEECDLIDVNHLLVVREGRRPGLKLKSASGDLSFTEVASDLLQKILKVASFLDKADNTYLHSKSVQTQVHKVKFPDTTPSGKILNMLDDQHSFIDAIGVLTREHQAVFEHSALASNKVRSWDELAQDSWEKQSNLEKSDSDNFDEFLDNYFKQIRLEF